MNFLQERLKKLNGQLPLAESMNAATVKQSAPLRPPIKGEISQSAAQATAAAASPSSTDNQRSILMNITPETARLWLERNPHNRPIQENYCLKLAVEIIEGRWQTNGEPIIIAVDGTLLDGQHRLTACVKSKTAIRSWVILGVDSTAMKTIDVGKARTAANIAAMEGLPHASLQTATAKLLIVHEQHGIERLNNTALHPAKTRIVAEVGRFVGLVDAAKFTAGLHFKGNIVSTSTVCFCYWLFSQEDATLAASFLCSLRDKIFASKECPIYQLRQRLDENALSRRKLGKDYVIALIFKAWIAYRDGKPVRQLLWRPNERFPSVPFPQAK